MALIGFSSDWFVGLIYDEFKSRPQSLVRQEVGFGKDMSGSAHGHTAVPTNRHGPAMLIEQYPGYAPGVGPAPTPS